LVTIASIFKQFLLFDTISRWGNDVAQICGSSFLSHFGGHKLFSHFDSVATISFVSKFEWIEVIRVFLNSLAPGWFQQFSQKKQQFSVALPTP